MDNEKLNQNQIEENDLESVSGGRPGTLVFRPDKDGFNEDHLVFNPDMNKASIDHLIVKGGKKENHRKKNPESSAVMNRNFPL